MSLPTLLSVYREILAFFENLYKDWDVLGLGPVSDQLQT